MNLDAAGGLTHPVLVIAADAPTYADVMQAWGTVLALPLSLGALFFTGLLLRHEMRARREERFETQIAQARLVRADREFEFIEGVGDAIEVRRKVFNHSDKPVFDVRIEIYFEHRRAEHLDSSTKEVVEPGGQRTLVIRMKSRPPQTLEDIIPVSSMLAFLDAEGRHWHRPDGDPSPQPYRIYILRDLHLGRLVADYLQLGFHLYRPVESLHLAYIGWKQRLLRKIHRRDAGESIWPLVPGDIHYFPPGAVDEQATVDSAAPETV